MTREQVLQMADRLADELLTYPELVPEVHERLILAFTEAPWTCCPKCGSSEVEVHLILSGLDIVAQLRCFECGEREEKKTPIPLISAF